MKNKLNKNFIEKLNSIYTKEELEKIEKWFNTKRKTVFRMNILKDDFDVLSELKSLWFVIKKISFLKNAYLIEKKWKIRLAETKSFKQWYIYIQWITSQIPVELITIKNPKKILDLTAAPWWKTTQVYWRFNKSTIIANELNKIRLDKLKYTINKQWCKDVVVLNKDARELKKDFENETFDVIIADLPCSAEWRINLDKEKTYKYLDKLWINKRNYKIQQDILKNTISLLKNGWELIYSTCTLDPLENEWIVHYLLINFPELEIVDMQDYFTKDWLKQIFKKWITKYKKYIFKKEVSKSVRLLPSEISEGFFVVKFKKNIS